MDEADAKATSSSALPESVEEVKSSSEQATLSEPAQGGSDDPEMMEDFLTSDASTAATKPPASGNAGKPTTKTTRKAGREGQLSAIIACETRSPGRGRRDSEEGLELDSTPSTAGARKGQPGTLEQLKCRPQHSKGNPEELILVNMYCPRCPLSKCDSSPTPHQGTYAW